MEMSEFINFGKYRDKTFSKIPTDYLRWMIREGTPQVEEAIEELNKRGELYKNDITEAIELREALHQLQGPAGQGITIIIKGVFEGYGRASEHWDMIWEVKRGEESIVSTWRKDSVSELANAIKKMYNPD